MWSPISYNELTEIIARDLQNCDSEALAVFESMKIEPRKAEFARTSVIDEIFIVAESAGKVIYYDDTEDGFEVGRLVGNRIEGGTGQFTLAQALRQILSESR